MRNVTKTHQIISLTVLFLFLNVLIGYGQEMSREREREIKTSGKYYFGECTTFDEAEAKDCALKELTQVVIVSMLQQALSENALLKSLEMQANTARLSMTGRVRVLAWIAKDSVYVDDALTKVELQQLPKTTPSTTPSTPSTPPTQTQTTSPTIENSSQSIIANPIVQNLAEGKTIDQFRRNAENWKRQGKLIYGARKTSFLSPEKCHIAVFSSGTLIALLGEGNNSRVDLLSGKTIQNPEQHYSGNDLIWIQIN